MREVEPETDNSIELPRFSDNPCHPDAQVFKLLVMTYPGEGVAAKVRFAATYQSTEIQSYFIAPSSRRKSRWL